jgi:hypothetical protein
MYVSKWQTFISIPGSHLPPPTKNTPTYICIHILFIGRQFFTKNHSELIFFIYFKTLYKHRQIKEQATEEKSTQTPLVKPRIPWLPLLRVHTKHDFSIWCQESKTQAKESVGLYTTHYFTAIPWPQTHRSYHKMHWISAFCISELKPESRF